MVVERAEIPAIHHYKVNMQELLWGHGEYVLFSWGTNEGFSEEKRF